MRHHQPYRTRDYLEPDTTTNATYARMPDGKTWGIRAKWKLEHGDRVEVWNQSAGKWEVRYVDKVVHAGDGYWLATAEKENT